MTINYDNSADAIRIENGTYFLDVPLIRNILLLFTILRK